MASPNDIKKGVVILQNGDPWVVTEFQHINPGKGAGIRAHAHQEFEIRKTRNRRTKARNNYHRRSRVSQHAISFYHDGTGYTFMDTRVIRTVYDVG